MRIQRAVIPAVGTEGDNVFLHFDGDDKGFNDLTFRMTPDGAVALANQLLSMASLLKKAGAPQSNG